MKLIEPEKHWRSWPIVELFWSSGDFSPSGSPEDFLELAGYVADGWVVMTEAWLRVSKTAPAGNMRAKGGREHSALKQTAYELAIENGDPAPRVEGYFWGCYPDVLAPSIRWWLECGDTSVTHVTEALAGNGRQGEHFERFVLLPYANRFDQSEIDRYSAGKCRVVTFERARTEITQSELRARFEWARSSRAAWACRHMEAD